MLINSFQSTEVGDIPLKSHNSIKYGEKLRLVVNPDETDVQKVKAGIIEILNPLEKRVVSGEMNEIDPSKLVYFDVIIPENWICGCYQANVLDTRNNVVCSNYFNVTSASKFQTYLTQKTISPKWRIHYQIKVKNPTTKTIGNFSAFVALPITILPQQIIKDLKTSPSNLKDSTDVEGNHWIHYELPRIDPQAEHTMSFSALADCQPIIISKSIPENYKINPYKKQFLKKYLAPEPHIESNHPKIVELASKISNKDPLSFAKLAAKLVNRKIKYKIQPDEYGAAYAIEKGEGDCTEFAALFVALCRAAGIPARTNAGFALAQHWERHATAEFLVGGRWIPIDVTGQYGKDIFLGSLPNTIIVTRGNWMGETIAKEVSYRYQIMEQTQKLDVNIDWKIIFEHGLTFKKKEPFDATSNKTIKILEPQMLDSSKVKILSETTKKKSIEIMGSDLVKLPSKTITNKKTRIDLPKKSRQLKQLSFDLSIPDIMKAGTMKNQVITIRNNSKSVHNGCFEIRRIEDGIIKLLSIQGVKISPNEQLKFKPAIKLDRTGSNTLEFVLMNRIGRTLQKEEKKVSVY
ncbi:MAG: transglutaminase domain-containing protein [Candidatus Heimdallarchaeota archaeon]|nr:transglutaminase domain-containing protein [Candidatus Heimdallarchaeota archaeon]